MDLFAVVFILLFTSLSYGQIPTPSQFLGIEVGADRTLADYRQITAYFVKLAELSKRIEIEKLGPTTLGNELFMAVISSEENIAKKDRYKEISKKLADPRGCSAQQIDDFVSEGKTIVLVTCNIHATEIAATQMAMEWAYALVTAQDEETKRRLDNMILLLMPSINPDGQIMEVEWYKKYLGTVYEGGRMPWLYHHYTGHDNNRDWFMLTQKETQVVHKAVYFDWFPNVWLDEHQMGSTGPRLFVPPYSNPVSPTIHPLVWKTVDHIGSMMSWRLEEAKKSGIVYGYMFDAYWPGGTKNSAWWRNIAGLLTEAASVRLATPVEISPTELSGGSKGLIEYRQQTNFTTPWRGGVWRLRDIMDYERIASDALLEVCSLHRREILRGSATMALDGIQSGKPGACYKISLDQRDPVAAARLAHLMRDNAVEVRFSDEEKAFYIPTAQPYSRFVNEFMNPQRYPKVKLVPGSSIVPPYDMTTWSLPLMMDVQASEETMSDSQMSRLRPISADDWPTGTLQNENDALFYVVNHQSNSSIKLINELLRRGTSVYLLKQSSELEGSVYPAGTIIFESVKDVAQLVRQYMLPLRGLHERPNVQMDKVREPKVALYKPWLASTDEGWTRWLLEQYRFNLKNIDNAELKGGKFIGKYDVILLPDVSKDIIIEGKSKREDGEMKYTQELPPEYAGGIGKEGVANLKKFVESGGTLVALTSSCALIMDEFNVPVSNILFRAKSDEFNCPGSLLRINVDANHPVMYGMPDHAAAFVNESIAFQTTIPGAGLSRKVLASYPSDAEDILVSGWMNGAEKLQNRAAVVALTYGKGKIVLIGFRAQHRAQTEGTFMILFNSLLWGGFADGK
jgi:hypothetical protein